MPERAIEEETNDIVFSWHRPRIRKMTRFVTPEEYRGSIGLSSGLAWYRPCSWSPFLRRIRLLCRFRPVGRCFRGYTERIRQDSGTRIPRIAGHVQIPAGSSWDSLRAGAIRHSLQHGDRIRLAEDAVEFQFLTDSDGRSKSTSQKVTGT